MRLYSDLHTLSLDESLVLEVAGFFCGTSLWAAEFPAAGRFIEVVGLPFGLAVVVSFSGFFGFSGFALTGCSFLGFSDLLLAAEALLLAAEALLLAAEALLLAAEALLLPALPLLFSGVPSTFSASLAALSSPEHRLLI